MTKNPSGRLSEVSVLIIPQVMRIHFSELCCPRTPRGKRMIVLIIPQVIRIYSDEWEVVLLLNFDRYKKEILSYVLLSAE